ncbi:hypothetical protein Nham_4034 [Nitrobacter hamburgensis X14]|uniref:Uncharacterized protein n=1 Tax=Nitrobacter hamburgensis (strain DSM 10229 / NCIMB 13809 / X14) TaxID=323097 RepID=Q1QGE7_NITHX|nr:DUF899 family protein [Nitrobacter hamburgensis]ABE64700.1 hypothetical protein Nham_4034 [Nitrobacter hamburgensis X14]
MTGYAARPRKLGVRTGKTCVFSPPGSSFARDDRGNIVHAYSGYGRGILEDSVTYKLLDIPGRGGGRAGGNPAGRAGRATKYGGARSGTVRYGSGG